jgi:hypothetical protein
MGKPIIQLKLQYLIKVQLPLSGTLIRRNIMYLKLIFVLINGFTQMLKEHPF